MSARTAPLVGVLLFLLSACEHAAPPPADDQSVRPARLFQVAPLGKRERYQFVSRVEAKQTVNLAFEVSGPLAKLPVREGQSVATGTLLAALEPTDFRLAVTEAKVALRLAQQDLERKQSLLTKRALPQAVIDDASAKADLARVKLSQAREALADAKLVAPFDAYIAKRFVDKHTNVRLGEPIVRLLDLSELHLVANVPEAMLATVTADRIALLEASFAFAPELHFDLEYRENSGEADAVAQTYEVTFAMPRPESWNILPGMTATVAIELSMPPTEALQVPIPTSALVTDAEGLFHVWIFDPDSGAVEKRMVEIGPASGAGVRVVSGLNGGELIVTTGASQLQPGMRVTPLGDPSTDLSAR